MSFELYPTKGTRITEETAWEPIIRSLDNRGLVALGPVSKELKEICESELLTRLSSLSEHRDLKMLTFKYLSFSLTDEDYAFKLDAIVKKLMAIFPRNRIDHYFVHSFGVPTNDIPPALHGHGINAVLDHYCEKHPEASEPFPVFVIPTEITGQMQSTDALGKMLREHTNITCGIFLSVNRVTRHWIGLFLEKQGDRLTIITTDSLGCDKEHEFYIEFYGRLQVQFRDLIQADHLSSVTITSGSLQRQFGSYGCFVYAVKDLFTLAKFPHLRASILSQSENLTNGMFAKYPPQLMKLTQSASKLSKYEATLNAEEKLELSLENLKVRHFVKGRNRKAIRQLRKFHRIALERFFATVSASTPIVSSDAAYPSTPNIPQFDH